MSQDANHQVILNFNCIDKMTLKIILFQGKIHLHHLNFEWVALRPLYSVSLTNLLFKLWIYAKQTSSNTLICMGPLQALMALQEMPLQLQRRWMNLGQANRTLNYQVEGKKKNLTRRIFYLNKCYSNKKNLWYLSSPQLF